MRSRGCGNLHAKVGADVAGIAAQHNDAVGQQHRFFNIVRHQEDGLGGHGLVGPQLQQFAAQILGGQHIQSAEGLVHEEHLRLDHQGARKTHPLLHSARQFLWIRAFKAVKSHRIQHLHAAFAAHVGSDAARLQRSLNIFKNCEPGKKSKALKNNGDVDLGIGDGFLMPVNLPCRWR